MIHHAILTCNTTNDKITTARSFMVVHCESQELNQN
jgi:hypothetical protein